MGKPESLLISWCDNGSGDSLFVSSLASLLMHASSAIKDISYIGINQTIGNQIARQRGEALKTFEETNYDWVLFVDSDIVIDLQAFNLLWENRNAETCPIISGVYFVSFEMNQSLPAPIPCVFKKDTDGNTKPINPLPQNEILPIDVAGLGFTLMHKSVAQKLRKAYGDTTFQIVIDTQHVSEDVAFFQKVQEVGITPKAHTGAIVGHVKRFIFDFNYYNLYWNIVAPMKEVQIKNN